MLKLCRGAGLSPRRSASAMPQSLLQVSSPGQGNPAIRRVQSEQTFESDSLTSSIEAKSYQEKVNLLEAKIREMQLDISRLTRKMRNNESEKTRSVVFSRRAALSSTFFMGLVTFVNRTFTNFQERRRLVGLFKRIFVPDNLAEKNSLVAFSYDAVLGGFLGSVPFFVAFGFLRGDKGWKRNTGFLISCLYSLYLAYVARFMPSVNTVSVAANVLFLVARYYLLHGLLSFGWVAHLH